MKKSILLFVCMGTMFCSFAQETPSVTSKPLLTKEDYLKKSKNYKTGALVSIIGGGSLFLIGAIVAVSDVSNSLDNIFTTNTSTTHDALIGVLVITGCVAMLGSIPLFIAAHRNKLKALSVSFKNELAPQLQSTMVFYKSVPSVSLKIRF